jgi:hypothetical protein
MSVISGNQQLNVRCSTSATGSHSATNAEGSGEVGSVLSAGTKMVQPIAP